MYQNKDTAKIMILKMWTQIGYQENQESET